MKEQAQHFLTSLEDLFLKFNVRRLLYWLFVISFIFIVLVFSERLTNYLYFWRIEKRITLLKELYSLDQSGIAKNDQLSPVYNDLVGELNSYKAYHPSININFRADQLWRFISGASVGLIGLAISIIRIYETRKHHDYEEFPTRGFLIGIILTSIWAIMFGIVGLLLPTIYSPWVNYIAFPILQVLLLLIYLYLVE